jgi:hypothetical protein
VQPFLCRVKKDFAVSKKIHIFAISKSSNMSTNYKVRLLASYHKKEHLFPCESYELALNKFKALVIDNSDFLSVLGQGNVTINIVDCDNDRVVRSFTATAIKPE